MLDSTFELINLAASNSLVIFCFCNLIIAILLVGSSKPSSEVDDEEKTRTHSLPRIAQRKENDGSLEKNAGSSSEGRRETKVSLQRRIAAVAGEEVIEASTINIAMVDESQDEREEEEEEEEDELRRRVEEFIEKAKRGWEAENLKTYGLVH